MTETLIERLRNAVGLMPRTELQELCWEAAEALRVLDETYGHTVGDLNEAQAALTVAQARIERLERGLKDIARGYSGYEPYSGAACADIARSVLFPDQEGELERDPAGQALVASDEAAAHLRPAGCDPSREALVDFAKWAIRESCWLGDDLDGGAVQDRAVTLGLLIEVPYDPKIHGLQDYAKPGDPWFDFGPVLASAGEARSDETRSGSVEDEHAAPQSGETPETCPADRGEWCPDPACLAKCKHVPPSLTTEERAVEEMARALQRWDFNDQDEADKIWNEDYEPDAYKAAYRLQARAAYDALSPSTTEERLRQAFERFSDWIPADMAGRISTSAEWCELANLMRPALSPDRHDKGDRLEVGR